MTNRARRPHHYLLYIYSGHIVFIDLDGYYLPQICKEDFESYCTYILFLNVNDIMVKTVVAMSSDDAEHCHWLYQYELNGF